MVLLGLIGISYKQMTMWLQEIGKKFKKYNDEYYKRNRDKQLP